MPDDPDARARVAAIDAISHQLSAIVPKLTNREFLHLLELMVRVRATVGTGVAIGMVAPPAVHRKE